MTQGNLRGPINIHLLCSVENIAAKTCSFAEYPRGKYYFSACVKLKNVLPLEFCAYN